MCDATCISRSVAYRFLLHPHRASLSVPQAMGAEGSVMEGARYVKKHHIFIQEACFLRNLPYGDMIVLPAGTPLHMRKDMMAAAAYRISVIAFMPDQG